MYMLNATSKPISTTKFNMIPKAKNSRHGQPMKILAESKDFNSQ